MTLSTTNRRTVDVPSRRDRKSVVHVGGLFPVGVSTMIMKEVRVNAATPEVTGWGNRGKKIR